eukprot:Gb_12777 [translate_table: standard]
MYAGSSNPDDDEAITNHDVLLPFSPSLKLPWSLPFQRRDIIRQLAMDCGVFMMNRSHLKRVVRKWRKGPMGYEELPPLGLNDPNDFEDCNEIALSQRRQNAHVTVVVGKERQVFNVDPHILEDGLFQSLLERARTWPINHHHNENQHENYSSTDITAGGCIIFLEYCDAILFEHMLWLVYNDDPSLLSLNLEELMEFYDQDAS